MKGKERFESGIFVVLIGYCLGGLIVGIFLVDGYALASVIQARMANRAQDYDSTVIAPASLFLDDSGVRRGDWIIHEIDNIYVGDNVDMELDSQFNIHVVYQDRRIDALRFLYLDDSGVYRTSFNYATSGGSGLAPSLELDADNHDHIVHQAEGSAAIRYITNQTGAWKMEDCNATGVTSRYGNRYLNLELSNDGNPQIAVTSGDRNSSSLLFSERTPSGWSVQTLDTECIAGWSPDLCMQKNGTPQIIYFSAGCDEIYRLVSDGINWSKETLVSGDIVGSISVAVAPDSLPHVAFSTSTGLHYLTLNSGTWSIEEVAAGQSMGWSASLKLDKNGNPVIAYMGHDPESLYYARREQGGWQVTEIWRHNIMMACDLEIDRLGRSYIAFILEGKLYLAKEYSETPLVMALLNKSTFVGGDSFRLNVRLEPPSPDGFEADLYIALEAYGNFYFYPSWKEALERTRIYLQGKEVYVFPILSFTWPQGVGAAENLRFYTLLTEPATSNLISNIDTAEFSFK